MSAHIDEFVITGVTLDGKPFLSGRLGRASLRGDVVFGAGGAHAVLALRATDHVGPE